jgi:DNA-binding transcriptional LysR family regulator
MRQEAPNVVLRFIGEAPSARGQELRDGQADLDIGVVQDAPPEIRVEPLYTDRMAAVVRKGHALTRAGMSLRRFAEATHVSASRRGHLRGPIDDVLETHGLKRRVALAVPTFAAALLVVQRSDLVGLMPRTLGKDAVEKAGLVALDPPMELPPTEISMAWHQRYDADGGHRWLRERVRETVEALTAG